MALNEKHSRAFRDLQSELRFWQMQVRLEMRWLRQSKAKCREIGRKMREENVGKHPKKSS